MNDNYPWIDGRLHSPHFLFLQTVDISIPRYLKMLGYPNAKERPCKFMVDGLAFTRCRSWTHIADDWVYTLWHRPDRLHLYKRLSRKAQLYTFAMGDADESYEFALFNNGGLIRRHVVDSPNYSDRVVRTSIGTPLPAETPELLGGDASTIGLTLAKSLGIEPDQSKRRVRFFQISNR